MKRLNKLPIVQYLFWAPAIAGSIRLWVILSASLCVIAALSLKKILILIIKQGSSLMDPIVNSIANCGAAYYLFSMSSTPDSLIHINPAASSFAVFSLYFLVISSCLYKFGTRRVLILILLRRTCPKVLDLSLRWV